ncbi:hypothetical protein [Candidatus Tisiphia endosymbiont of Ptychoptera albimana]|jgi:pyruvate kinase|uniref:hypothetical protein n=1 Tax=Candidatus Tisiphia endosymbiont of Ptychoptera albimana TaxID=3066260 RepID=UPI00312C7F4D
MTDKTTLPSKAIVLLNPAYDAPTSLKLRNNIITASQKNGLTIVGIIQSTEPYDHATLGQLIRQIMTCSNKPVTILIDEELRHTTINTLLWAVLGTLSSANLIAVTTYNRCYEKVLLQKVNIEDDYLLYVAATYCKRYHAFGSKKSNLNIDE